MMVGLEHRPFAETRLVDVRNTVIISGVLVILGMAKNIQVQVHPGSETVEASVDPDLWVGFLMLMVTSTKYQRSIEIKKRRLSYIPIL